MWTDKINQVWQGDCLEVMKKIPENSVDSIVTDPPYHLVSIVKRFGKDGSAPAKEGRDGSFKRLSGGFMGKTWDGLGEDGIGIANNPKMWAECLRVLKPGGHLLAFSGTRTYHRMASAIEDAGFEVRDMIEWVYGSGFPKSLNIGKAVDKLQGNERDVIGKSNINIYKGNGNSNYTCAENATNKEMGYEKSDITKGTSEWEGWGTALKPAHEPICMARKPLGEKTVAENCLKWGTGGINIDESRVEYQNEKDKKEGQSARPSKTSNANEYALNHGGLEGMDRSDRSDITGRFPANLIHDGSEEVRECFPEQKSGARSSKHEIGNEDGEMFNHGIYGKYKAKNYDDAPAESCNASRFFKSIIYQAKASKSERNNGCEGLEKGCSHPTVKPIALMEYLIKMVTPKGGIVLDPFAGSGSTLVACKQNNFQYIGIEQEAEYIEIIKARLDVVIENKQQILL